MNCGHVLFEFVNLDHQPYRVLPVVALSSEIDANACYFKPHFFCKVSLLLHSYFVLSNHNNYKFFSYIVEYTSTNSSVIII